jgi:hypothetical protein
MAGWTRRGSQWEGEENGWGLRVYFDDEPILGDPVWVWSAMRFANPDDDADDRIATMGGQAKTAAAAKRAAAAAARRAS